MDAKNRKTLAQRASRLGLYTRGVVSVGAGGAALLGALAVISHLMVRDARERLLDERMHLARASGRLLESQLRNDIARVEEAAREVLGSASLASGKDGQRTLLEHSVRNSILHGGVMVITASRELRAAVFVPEELRTALPGLDSALTRCAHKDRPIVLTAPARLPSGRALGLVSAVRGKDAILLGYVVGFVRPEGSDLLHLLPDSGTDDGLNVALLYRSGADFASARSSELGLDAYAGEQLRQALDQGKELRGIYRGQSGASEPAVLVMAPMPRMPLSVAVLQPESQALLPAHLLRQRLFQLGGALVILFVGFNLLAIRSVVDPVQALTAAVRRAEARAEPLERIPFRAHEVVELAEALSQWQGQTRDALAQAADQREALRIESQAIASHLHALQSISDVSREQDLQRVLDIARERAVELVGAHQAVLELRYRRQQVIADAGLCPKRANVLLDAARRGELASTKDDKRDPGGVTADVQGCTLEPLRGLRLTFGAAGGKPFEGSIFLSTLLRHTGMCLSHILLLEVERERREQQSKYIQRVLRAQEDERKRIARELHDTVAQDLAALRLDAERLAAVAPDARRRAQLEAVEKGARDCLVTVRRILLDLRPEVLENLGLVAALSWLLERAEQHSGIETHLMLDGDDAPELDYETAISLFRVAQEAVLNVLQHAAAERIHLNLRSDDEIIELTVEDDGCGFDSAQHWPDASREPPGGLGIVGMRERAHLVHGELSLHSAPGEGTVLHVRVPRRLPRPSQPVSVPA